MKEMTYYHTKPVPETPKPQEQAEPWGETQVVGRPEPRVDGYQRTSGGAVYPSDVNLPGMLHGAILRCPHPHARMTRIDTSKAEAMPGVHAVVTDKTPGADIPWYQSRSRDGSRLFDDHCRFEGEAVAAIAADTPYQAWDAARAIEVEYEVLPFTVDYRKALEPDAPIVWGDSNRTRDPGSYERGDIEAGFAEADVVLEETYSTECELHVPMESFGSVAQWEGGKLTVWHSAQGVYPMQQGLAQAFGLPLSHVRAIGHYVGGGFGAKLGIGKYSVIAALLAKVAARPVKLFITREETLLCAGNRPAVQMRLKAGVKRDGTLVALEMENLGSGGAYSGSGTGSADFQTRDLYTCPNVRTESHDVYINAGEQRPMRAPGHPQNSWALEQMMDALAEAIEMCPVELRLKNIPTVSQARGDLPYSTTGFKECLQEGAGEFGWAEARSAGAGDGHLRRGVGVAGCLWAAGAGGPPSTAVVRYFADGSCNLNMGASDIGTGTKTVMAMVVAEELGVPLERITIEYADTGTTQYASASGGSKTVPTESPAVRDAALNCKSQIIKMAAGELEVPAEDLVLENGEVRSTVDPGKSIAVGRIGGFRAAQVVVGVGYRGPNPEDTATCPFAAQFCEVEVNTRTGEVKVLRFLGAHDSGRVMNRMTYDNQIYGGITMGIGLGMTERRILDANQTGKMVNRNFHDYKIPTALDVPADMSTVAIDLGDDFNTTGAKGIGEPVTIPTAAAVANAVYNAVGVRITSTPVNPTSLVAKLAAKEEGRG